MYEISHESLESDESDDPTTPPYILPCRHDLSKSQKKIVEERVRAIRSEVPIYVTVMKNNNAGDAQRWMLVSSLLFLVLNYHNDFLKIILIILTWLLFCKHLLS